MTYSECILCNLVGYVDNVNDHKFENYPTEYEEGPFSAEGEDGGSAPEYHGRYLYMYRYLLPANYSS